MLFSVPVQFNTADFQVKGQGPRWAGVAALTVSFHLRRSVFTRLSVGLLPT